MCIRLATSAKRAASFLRFAFCRKVHFNETLASPCRQNHHVLSLTLPPSAYMASEAPSRRTLPDGHFHDTICIASHPTATSLPCSVPDQFRIGLPASPLPSPNTNQSFPGVRLPNTPISIPCDPPKMGRSPCMPALYISMLGKNPRNISPPRFEASGALGGGVAQKGPAISDPARACHPGRESILVFPSRHNLLPFLPHPQLL